MPLFLSDEEYSRCANDAVLITEKADAYIRVLSTELETVKAQADASSITAEQTCSLIEQKYLSLSSEYSNLQSQNTQLNASLEERLSELAQAKADKHQLHLTAIGKDGEIERLMAEASEHQKSKRQLMELLAQKDSEISEKNATIQSYLDKIVNLTENSTSREARLNEVETELARSQSMCARLSQEKELIERHNKWLNEELTAKVDSIIDIRKMHNELEAEISSKLANVERQFDECSSSLKWHKERVRELEMKLTSVQEDFCSIKDAAATNEERLSAEISTINKLADLYKESSEEWSKKAGELEGVIKALETHLSQIENDYKEKLENEVLVRKIFEKEAAELKEKLEKHEAEIEASRKANESNLLQLTDVATHTWIVSSESDKMAEDNHMLVPKIPVGVSGTALAASLLRDGWSLAKMYCKYQEAVDAMRHEQLGRKSSEAILQRVLYELEEKAEAIMDERAEHERMVEAYSMINQKLQHSLSEQENLEKTIKELKAESRRQERDYAGAQKEIADLQTQVTILLKECRDIQLHCGSSSLDYTDDRMTTANSVMRAGSDAETVISERLLTFKDINGLVEQNVQLRSLVRNLSEQIENRDIELKEKFDLEIKNHTDEASSRVVAVLQRAEEQAQMIEALHSSVAMYKRLYEEEQKRRSSTPNAAEVHPESGKKNFLPEDSNEASKRAREHYAEQVKHLEEDLSRAKSELVSIRNERDKLALEANFAQEKLQRFIQEVEQQRGESNGILARNIEFSQLIIDYQRKLRESSESLHAAEDVSRKLTMEVSILKHEKEMLTNAEKRAYDEVRSLSERVHRLQASLGTIQSTEEAREEARVAERRKQEEHIKQIEREWAEAKKELQEERDNVRMLTLDREQTMKNAMRQVEEIGKELSSALHAVAAAEARAAVAEARYSDLEKKIKTVDNKIVGMDAIGGPSSFSVEAVADLHAAKEEVEKLKEEAQANKDHMLQYKNIAQVNEAALKQMENAHENFKIEAEKWKSSLEAESMTLRERISELESECSLKANEIASVTSGKDEALGSALAEISRLKEECSSKTSQIMKMEIQISALSGDLEKEHQRWRTAQANYERQVILQSETIQELTKTSEALSSLQEEASELRRSADAYRSENNELKANHDGERSMLEETKAEAERKYHEIDEQNKILHSRVEALHIQLAERDRNSAGMSSGSIVSDLPGDSGLQSVINYLRRSKEIAETEISLLKQEKLRLQSQLESALKAAESAQTSLHAERTTSRSLLFSEEEIKSLQLQVREMNLLRESNMQLREENKYNFEECQKLREVAQKARVDTENLENKLREKEIELETCKEEIEMQKMEKDLLEKRLAELLERYNNVDVEDYDRMKVEVCRMQVNLKEKETRVEEINVLVSEKQEIISKLEQDLANCRLELKEKENKINDSLQVEASLKSDFEKHKRIAGVLKKRYENLSKEKEELSKENQVLSKQLEDYKHGKRSIGDVTSEQAMKEKEEKDKEKDTRIQSLERTLERLREELKKAKDELRAEKTKRQNFEKTLAEVFDRTTQDKSKFVEEFEKHKQAAKSLLDELEKLKNVKGSLAEDTSAVQLLSSNVLDDHVGPYLASTENLEKVVQSSMIELRGHAVPTGTSAETSPLAAAVQSVPAQAPSTLPFPVPTTTRSPTKVTEEKEKRLSLLKANVETRKMGRKLVRPRLLKPEEPQIDVEMSEAEGTSIVGKLAGSLDSETQGNTSSQTQPPARKRLASFPPELHEDSNMQGEAGSDVGAPVSKKSKGLDSQEGTEGQCATSSENIETLPATEESAEVAPDFPQGSTDEAVDVERDEVEAIEEEFKEPQELDGKSQVDLQDDKNSEIQESLDKPSETEVTADDVEEEAAQGLQPSAENEREEGELDPDNVDIDFGGDISTLIGSPGAGEGQSELEGNIASPTTGIDDSLAAQGADITEMNSPEILNEEKNDETDVAEETIDGSDKSNDGNDQTVVDASESPLRSSTVGETGVSKEGAASSSTVDAEAKQILPGGGNSSTTINLREGSSSGSTTINLHEKARQGAMLRQAGMLPTSVTRGRGRPAARGRGVRGRARGRGQSPGNRG